MAELLGRHVKFLDGESSRLGVEQGEKQVAGLNLVVILVLLAHAVERSIIVLPLEQLYPDATFFVDSVQTAHEVTEGHTVILQFFGGSEEYFDCLHHSSRVIKHDR